MARRYLLSVIGLVAAALWTAGCQDPADIGRFRATPATNVILDELGVVDERPDVFAGARDVAPRDLQVIEKEYVIGPGDIVEISIVDLYVAGEEWIGRRPVSETGRITIPEVGTFRAAGQTELELVETIKDRLSPQIIRDPMVTVVVIQARGRIYSVSGAVPAPGTYELTETDFRIMRALAAAGGIPQQNADYAYVIRTMDAPLVGPAWQPEPAQPTPSRGAAGQNGWRGGGENSETRRQQEPARLPDVSENGDGAPAEAPGPGESREERQRELLESISPTGEISLPMEIGPVGASQNGDEVRLQPEIVMAVAVAQEDADKPLRVERENDRFVLEPTEEATDWEPARDDVLERPLPAPPGEPMADWEEVGKVQEVIRVDLRKLRGGDWTQNVVIRPGDDIQVPLNETGIFSVMGEVARPGAYSMAGERLTLKQAIANAGPLTPTAWPSRCEIIRRISDNEEVTCRVNLLKLFEGTAPDIFLKPHDILNVGTHPVARFTAVVRQSFRTTYGFGFVYDRNFADVDFGR